jgi:hypothetical protein
MRFEWVACSNIDLVFSFDWAAMFVMVDMRSRHRIAGDCAGIRDFIFNSVEVANRGNIVKWVFH